MATPEGCIPPQLDVGNTLGAAFIGNVLAAMLYGITNLQTYLYFDRCRDAAWLRTLIFFLWILDTVHIALMTHTVYFYAVTNFMNAAAIADITWSIMAVVSLTGVSDLVVRGIFSYRLWRVSGNNVLLMLALAVSSLLVFEACSIAFTVRGTIIGSYTGLADISWILYTAFGAGVVADVTIATSLCIVLWQRRTGFRRTDSIVRVLMLYSINTGAFTSLCAIAVLVTYASMPDNFVFISFYFILPKLFLNSLLATLNAREKLRDTGSGIVSIPLSTSVSSPLRTARKTELSRRSSDQMVEIQVETTTDRKTDSMSHMPQASFSGMYGSRSWQEQSRFASSGDIRSESAHAIQ